MKKDGSPAKWKVENGYFEVVPRTGNMRTKESYGDCQLHVEFREPDPARGEDQDRGNSGVFLMGLYEIQVLDSYNSKNPRRRPSLGGLRTVSAAGQRITRAPGQWQTYDILWHGQRDEYPAAWDVTAPEALRALEHFLETQEMAPWLHWHEEHPEAHTA